MFFPLEYAFGAVDQVQLLGLPLLQYFDLKFTRTVTSEEFNLKFIRILAS